MKCQKCEKPSTFHITELTGNEPQEVHLCANCAKEYLTMPSDQDAESASVAGVLAEQLKIGETAEDLARLDQQSCPVCGITFYEFRHVGRLGCPYDYVCFEQELEPLIENIHGETKHTGKRPKRGTKSLARQTALIQLRREMKEAVEREEYERASELRDEIHRIEKEDVREV